MPYIKRLKKRVTNKDNSNAGYRERHKVYNDGRWKSVRDGAMLKSGGLCVMCLKEGRITPAVDVHHVKSFMTADDEVERTALAFDPDNVIALCKECHQKIHNGGMGLNF